MPLSNEDSLRLNVLSAQPVKAIRINESSMVLTALTDKGEARIELSPNSRHDDYLRDVREFLSEKYLGMPGGYPRHLERWTRMGVTHNSLDKMLLLGEPEAIVALAYSSEINSELARHAWWVYQSPEIARNLLKSHKVANSSLGPELAQFLLEFLPFEERPLDIVDSVNQCLQGKLISDRNKVALWERAKRKNPYFVGFMLAGPKSIPLKQSEHSEYEAISNKLGEELANENPFALYYIHFLSSDGRKWLNSLRLALKKPTDPNVVIALFIAIDQYIDLIISEKRGVRDIEQAVTIADDLCAESDAPKQLCKIRNKLDTQQIDQLKAVLVLAQLGENTLNEIFGGRDATGTVMRRHLQPLTTRINTTINTLLS